ncbi:MAG: hypothetical protein ABIV11_04880 [Gemmatimonadaceae bacterium]
MMAVAVLASCQGPTDPQFDPAFALLTTINSDGLLTVVNLRSGAVVEQPTSDVGVFGEDARAHASSVPTLYYAGAGKLVSFDLIRRAPTWTELLGGSQQARWGEQSIYANFSLALTPDETKLLAADSYYQGILGVAVLNLNSRTATGFVSGLRARKMFTIHPGALLPDGGVLALGTTLPKTFGDDTERRRGKLYLLSGNPLTIQDSIKFLSASDSAAGGVAEMIVDRAGKYAYFTTYNGKLHKFDLTSRAYAGSLTIRVYGPLALSPDGAWVYVIDGTHTRDYPGSGFMYMADAGFAEARAIDLNSAARDGLPPQLNSIAVSSDGSHVYIGAGTAPRGPLFGVQRGSVIVVDTQSRVVEQRFSLPTWGVSSILLL